MGTFAVALDIGDMLGERFQTVEAPVNTGAGYTAVSASVRQQLGVEPHTTVNFVLADRSRIQRTLAGRGSESREAGSHSGSVRG